MKTKQSKTPSSTVPVGVAAAARVHEEVALVRLRVVIPGLLLASTGAHVPLGTAVDGSSCRPIVCASVSEEKEGKSVMRNVLWRILLTVGI